VGSCSYHDLADGLRRHYASPRSRARGRWPRPYSRLRSDPRGAAPRDMQRAHQFIASTVTRILALYPVVRASCTRSPWLKNGNYRRRRPGAAGSRRRGILGRTESHYLRIETVAAGNRIKIGHPRTAPLSPPPSSSLMYGGALQSAFPPSPHHPPFSQLLLSLTSPSAPPHFPFVSSLFNNQGKIPPPLPSFLFFFFCLPFPLLSSSPLCRRCSS